MTVYVTAQVVGVALALLMGWVLVVAEAPVWGAAVCWLCLSAYLSRKRLPSQVVGAALQVAAVVAVLVPVAPYAPALLSGADVSATAVARELFGPALLFAVCAVVAYAVGHLLKRRARRKLVARARKDVYRFE